jgi:hypothetical protein
MGLPIAAAVARSLHSTFECKRYVFLLGHLGWQVERILPKYLSDLECAFIEDGEGSGTAHAVWCALKELETSDFLYSHGNVLLGPHAMGLVAEGFAYRSALAVSSDIQASTHPRVVVDERSRVNGVGAPEALVGSVGLAAYRHVAHSDGLPRPALRMTVEEMMLGRTLSMPEIRAVDIGPDWRHLEDLSFYP